MKTTILQLHKRDSGEYKYIQDKYAINLSSKTFALADGTTQSFKSEKWAEILTSYFAKNPIFDIKKLISNFVNCVEDFKSVNFDLSSNPAKASLEKEKQLNGGTATFIGVQFIDNIKMKVVSCGDSNLFVLNKENELKSFPFSNLESLDNNNFFINTEQLIADNFDESFFHQNTLEVHFGEIVILATDALSRLILEKPKIINELIQLNDFDEFHKFCLKYWDSKELQEDDISAIIINADNESKVITICPPNDFAFPKAKEELFMPSPLTQETSIKFTDMQMQEIRNQFNGVATDFFQIKKKINLIIVLLISTIGLIMVSLFFVFLFWMSNGHQEQKTIKKETQNMKGIKSENKNNTSNAENFNKQQKSQASTKKESTPTPKSEKE